MTTMFTDSTVPSERTSKDRTALPPSPTRPLWAIAGWASGILALAVFALTPAGLEVPTSALDDNQEVADHLVGTEGWVWAFQTATFVLAILIVVFGLGLRRRLAGQGPTGSMLPDVAAIGMVLVTALTLVGGGISTEMFWTIHNLDEADPDTLAAQLMIFNTMSWVWAGGILTTSAIAVAGIRHGSVSRGLGRFAAVMTVLIAVTQAVPLQYLAVAPVSLFLIVAGISMHREVGRRGANLLATDGQAASETGSGRYSLH